MVARGAGDVGCAHCTVIGADRTCQVCTRLVCEKCGADWTTCPEPTGREVRLGRTARLRDVDPTGSLGLVTRWVGDMKLFDVRKLRWVDAQLPRHNRVRDGQILERLTPTGEVYFNRYASSGDAQVFDRLARFSLSSNTWDDLETLEPSETAGMTKDGRYVFVSSTQLVVIVDPDATVHTFEPLPKRVVQACYLDPDTGILASATWGEIVLHRIEGDALVLLDRVATTGNVSWIALEEPWLAACVGGVIRVWRVGENFAIGREVHGNGVGNSPTGTLSRDGRYLAAAAGSQVVLHDLDQDVTITYEDHSDAVCLVRFSGTDQLLITADEDNRVVLRPRTPAGYVRTVIDVDIPDEPIPLVLPTPP